MLYFEKYHGTGNDFIIVSGEDLVEHPELLAKQICDRHFGVGADGLMIVQKSTQADVKMDFYNADGTTAPMCGNGIRCFTKYVYDHVYVNKPEFIVETKAGNIPVTVTKMDAQGISQIRVNLGKPQMDLNQWGVTNGMKQNIQLPIAVNDKVFLTSIITVGTLHAVIYVPNLASFDIAMYGEKIANHPLFDEGINVNFVEMIDEQNIKVRTYERGVGPTLSCGTGSAASAYIGCLLKGLANTIQVHLLGGKLLIEIEKEIFLTGPASLICKGYYHFQKEGGI